MRVIVISPEAEDPREVASIEALLGEGLERYHVRKPSWSPEKVEAWLGGLPPSWRPRIALHGNPGIAARLGLGGRHERAADPEAGGTSRSVHALAPLSGLRARYEYLLFGPVFPSLSKPGYGPAGDFPWAALKALLSSNTGRGQVYAIGGVTAECLERVSELGFDGAAVLGAVWGRPDPVRAYAELRAAAVQAEEACHGA